MFMFIAIQVVTGDGSRVPAILLANKCDLREESTVMIVMNMIIMAMLMITNVTIMTNLAMFMIMNYQVHDD